MELILDPGNTSALLNFYRILRPYLLRLKEGDLPQSLFVKFRGALFLQPQHIVLLASVFESYIERGVYVVLDFEPGSKVQEYLQQIRFHEYWQPGFDRTAFTRLTGGSSFCLWKIAPSMISQYRDEAVRYFSDKFFPGLNLDPLTISMSEVFNNIREHSESPISGYTLTQYFPKSKQLIMSVCDLGIGIPTSINRMLENAGQQRKADPDAVEHAMQRRVTSQSTPKNRGYGLDNIRQQVQSFDGNLMILSNFACLSQQMSFPMKKYLLVDGFPGTLIVFSLKTDKLPIKEEELTEDFAF